MIGNVVIKHGRVLVDNKVTSNPIVIGLAVLSAAEEKPENEHYLANKKRLFNFLKKHNYNQTVERFEILKTTHYFENAFTISQVYSQMIEQKRFISLSAVYKTFKILIDANILMKVIEQSDVNIAAKFELIK